MLKSLKHRLALLLAAFLLVSIALFFLIANREIESLFITHANDQQEQRIQQIIFQVNDLFQNPNGTVSLDGLETIGNAALQNGILLHVTTLNREIDWDITTHKSDECNLILQHRELNMHSRYPTFEGGYEQRIEEITYNGIVIGEITLGYYGPFTFDDAELELVDALNRLLIILGTTFIVIAAVLGLVIAASISKPISSASTAARRISQGEYGVQIAERYTTAELQSLVDSINEMSSILKAKEEQKHRLTADVAHELRTPLTNLQGFIEAVIDGIWEPTTEMMVSCHEEIERLTRIVNLLLELDKYEDKRITLQYSSFSAMELCASVVNMFLLPAQEKNIRLQYSTDAFADICYADEGRLKQCMVNLVSNALRYTPEGGSIDVSYQNEEWYHVFAVRDTGIGISEENLEQIFERFFRADKSRNQKTGGIGIGLTITKAIVDMHGGIISVNSEPGKGSCFTIKIPKADVSQLDRNETEREE